MLIECIVCGNKLATDADRCPKCRTADPFGLIARKEQRSKWLALIVFGSPLISRGYLNQCM